MGTLADLGYGSGSGKRGGVNQKQSELKSAVKKAGKKDKGLLARAKGIADATGLDELANPVMKALSTLDLPRATVVSGIAELADTIGGGKNTHGFVKGIKEHEGVGKYVHTGNKWLDRGLGFAGDVAADPLTYLTLGASAPIEGVGRLAELSSKQAARELLDKGAEKLGQAGAEKAAAKALRDGVTSLSRQELDAIGAKSGAKFGVGRFKAEIPGTEGVARKVNATTRPLRDAAKGIGLQDKFAVVPELAKMRRSTNPRDVVHAFLFEDALTRTLGQARGMKNALADHLNTIAAENSAVDGETLLRAIEGDAAARVAVPEWKHLHDFFEGAREQASALTGREIPKIEDYAPWKLTRELRDEMADTGGRLGSTAKKVGPERRSLLRAEDAEFAGVELKGTTNAERRAEIEAIAKDKFGTNYKQVLRDNPWELAHAYINDMERYVQRHGLDKALLDSGVTQRTGLKLKEVKKAVKKKGRLEKLAASLLDDAGVQAETASAARGAMPGELWNAQGKLGEAQRLQGLGDEAAAKAAQAEGGIAGVRSNLQDLDLDREALQGQLDELPAAAGNAESFDDIGATWRDVAKTDEAKARFDALPDDADVVVYHGTTPENAAALRESRTVAVPEGHVSDLPTAARDAMYVAPTKADAAKYGDEVIEITVKKGDLKPSPEALRVDPNATTTKALFNSFDGAVLPSGHALQIGEVADRSALDAAMKELGIATSERDALVAAAKTKVAKGAATAGAADTFKGISERQLQVVEKALKEADDIASAGTRSAIEQANARYRRIAEFFNERGVAGVHAKGGDRLLQSSADLHDAIRVVRQRLPKSELPSAEKAIADVAAPKTSAKLSAAETRVAKAKEVVQREQTAFDQAGAAKVVDTQRDEVAAQLADIEAKIASGETKLTAQVERQRTHLDNASKFWKEAEVHRTNGNAGLAKVAELEGTAQASEAAAVAAGDTATKMLDKAGKIVTLKHSEKAAISDMVEHGLKQVTEGRWAEPWVADAALQVQQFMQPDEVGRLLKTADKVLARWKAYSLLSPGFHIRNFIGGTFNNALAGVKSEMYFRYARAAKAFANGGIEAVDESLREGYQAMLDHGVIGAGNVRDLADVAPELGRGQAGLLGSDLRKYDPTALDNAVLAKNRDIGESVENHLRGTLFLDQWLKNGNVDQALEAVAKYHFDYGMLAPWEQKYARRVIPFYTWSRKNFPLQIEYMLRKPGAYTRYLHAKRNVELGVPEDDVVPQYYSDLLAIRTPFTSGKGDRMYFTPDLPFRDLAEQFNVDRTLGQLNPLLKVPLETSGNKQFYSGLPFKEGMQEAPKTWGPLLAVLAPMGGKFGLPKVKRSGGKFFIGDKDAYKIEQTLPLLGRMRRALPSEERYQSRAVTTYLSLIGGIGARTLDNGQKFGELSRRVKAVQALNKQWDDLNPKTTP